MSLREKLGQLLVVYFFGEFTSTESGEYKDLVRQVTQNHVGGFILGTKRQPLGIERGGVYVAAVLANQMQKRAKVPLIVGADFERGTAMRIDEGTGFPYAMAVAAAGNPQDAYTVGKITALEARAAGIQWIFAPDADVNDNPDNPIINVRSFGEDPRERGALRFRVRARRAGKWRTGDGETFSRARRCERGFAYRACDGAGRSQAA